MSEQGDITALLHRWREGASDAENELFTRVLPELRRLAHYLMNRERRGHSLQATELVDQIYIKLVKARDRDWRNRQHFFAVAARAMRRHLIDHARGRPSAELVALDGIENLVPADSANLEQAIAVDRLLDQLATVNPQWCTVVELKYFLGLTDDEAAGISFCVCTTALCGCQGAIDNRRTGRPPVDHRLTTGLRTRLTTCAANLGGFHRLRWRQRPCSTGLH